MKIKSAQIGKAICWSWREHFDIFVFVGFLENMLFFLTAKKHTHANKQSLEGTIRLLQKADLVSKKQQDHCEAQYEKAKQLLHLLSNWKQYFLPRIPKEFLWVIFKGWEYPEKNNKDSSTSPTIKPDGFVFVSWAAHKKKNKYELLSCKSKSAYLNLIFIFCFFFVACNEMLQTLTKHSIHLGLEWEKRTTSEKKKKTCFFFLLWEIWFWSRYPRKLLLLC